jgi:hypothetical protein
MLARNSLAPQARLLRVDRAPTLVLQVIGRLRGHRLALGVTNNRVNDAEMRPFLARVVAVALPPSGATSSLASST